LAALIASYFVAFQFYYCVVEGCTHPANWLFHLPAEAQAAWVGSLGTLVAVWSAFALFWQEANEKREANRKAVQPIAYELLPKLTAIVHKFRRYLTPIPGAEIMLMKCARDGSLDKLTLPADTVWFSLLQDDEISALTELNALFNRYNLALDQYRVDGDLETHKSWALDLLHLMKAAESKTAALVIVLRTRYADGDWIAMPPESD
jgi:hypothetical protein